MNSIIVMPSIAKQFGEGFPKEKLAEQSRKDSQWMSVAQELFSEWGKTRPWLEVLMGPDLSYIMAIARYALSVNRHTIMQYLMVDEEKMQEIEEYLQLYQWHREDEDDGEG